MPRSNVFKLAGAVAALLGVTSAQNSSSLPVVDLGYELHQASSFNESGGFYNFSNIRYASPPVGNLRFAAPEAPVENRTSVQTGNTGRICPQAGPVWSSMATQFLVNILLGLPNNDTTPYIPPGANTSTQVPPQDARASEDCLFLDVFVPEQVFSSAGKGCGAPVLVWIYGGGYVVGDKNNNPAGLLAASGNVTDGEVIYVAMNYRLGAMGWSSGPSYQAEGGVANLGLLDQRFALEWVQKYIHLFGGDPERVTVFGESAGGGSIMHQITAYGGLKGKVPFQQAVPQSPGWLPVSSNLQQEDHYRQLLNITNTSSLAELRALSEEDMIRANFLQVTYYSPYGAYTYGPTVDGSFVPQQPGQLLAQGQFDKSLRVMVGHNTNEGTYFTPPYIKSTADIVAQLHNSFPYIPDSSVDYITNTLYPAVYNGTYPYTTPYTRASFLTSEAVFTCNTYYLQPAFLNQSYSYLFAVPPAFHGLDVAYTYYTGGAVSAINPFDVMNRTVALALQDFITSFAINGKPQAEGVRSFEMYGPDAKVLELNVTGVEEVVDSNFNERCRWWQKALYS
ncbi:alpha/beta-hydrolase [Lindgomyces ingoldianus]|uniref:Alpha/beta-hydrolase n=1 Tax=Lindgomyces ingoldianus TaxID=673940 RepID=A0ACB6QUX6_9PLEO|nr:alpha/beta-hydrolase [Lindgomyces ingoldianus]KAF2470305.1 alpha/beta-hydrolase [Lindgomyces ingoldianus]